MAANKHGEFFLNENQCVKWLFRIGLNTSVKRKEPARLFTSYSHPGSTSREKTFPSHLSNPLGYQLNCPCLTFKSTCHAPGGSSYCAKTDNFMADVANRYPENVAGKYYVDNQCIDCDLCRETAPDNFKRNEDGGYSFVYKQPESPEEEARCKEAKEGCPVEAIGDNGA